MLLEPHWRHALKRSFLSQRLQYHHRARTLSRTQSDPCPLFQLSRPFLRTRALNLRLDSSLLKTLVKIHVGRGCQILWKVTVVSVNAEPHSLLQPISHLGRGTADPEGQSDPPIRWRRSRKSPMRFQGLKVAVNIFRVFQRRRNPPATTDVRTAK